MKIVLTAGGKGTRIPEITGGIIPKSLCRLIDRPLVGYQLDEIGKVNPEAVAVVLDEDWQIQLFKESIRIGEFPKLNYLFFKQSWKHPLKNFKNPDVLDFLDGRDFIWTYGDLAYNSDLLTKIEKLSESNNTSVGCRIFSADVKPLNVSYVNYEFDETGKIIGYNLADKPNFTLHAPFYFKRSAVDCLKKELSVEHPRSSRLLMR